MQQSKKIRPLTELEVDEPAVVASIKLDPKEAGRLADLGLRIGAPVRILQAPSPNAPLLTAVLDARIGVDHNAARRIYVF